MLTCVQLRFSADDMTLPAFAADERRRCCRVPAPAISSKPAARHRCCRSTVQTDGGRTADGQTDDTRAFHAMQALSIMSGMYEPALRKMFCLIC